MENRAPGVSRLQAFLQIEGFEDVGRIVDGKLRRIRIKGAFVRAARDDSRKILFVVGSEAERCAFGGRRFEVEKLSRRFLIVGEAASHIIEYAFGKGFAFRIDDRCAEKIEAAFVHAAEPYRIEVIVERVQIALRIGVEPRIEEVLDHFALYAQAVARDVHEIVEPLEKGFFVFCEKTDLREVDRDDAEGTGKLVGTEKASAALSKLAFIEAETAAHGAHVARIQIGIDEILKIGSAVLGCHFKKQFRVFAFPFEILCDIVRRNGVAEAPSRSVSFEHEQDKLLIDYIHLFLAIAVRELLFFAAYDRFFVFEVVGTHPVERDVRKGRLTSPAARRVDAEQKALDALPHALFRKIVDFDEGRKIGVERAERLSARPFVLHDAEEVHHLVDERRKVCRGRRGDFIGNAAESFLNELPQRPARTVAGKHRKVVNVEGRRFMRVRHFFRIDIVEPIVCRNGAGIAQDETAEGKIDVRVFFDAPIASAQIFVHRFIDVEHEAFCIADRFMPCAVEDIRFCNFDFVVFDEDAFDVVLNLFDGGNRMRPASRKAQAEPLFHCVRKLFRPFGILSLFDRFDRAVDRRFDFFAVVARNVARPLYDGFNKSRRLFVSAPA